MLKPAMKGSFDHGISALAGNDTIHSEMIRRVCAAAALMLLSALPEGCTEHALAVPNENPHAS